MSRASALALRSAAAALGLALVGWTVAHLGPERVWSAASRADPIWLAASALPLVGRFLIWGLKWHRMLRRDGQIAFRDALRVLMAGCFVNLTTPTAKIGGGIVRAGLLRRRLGWRKSTAYGWALADQATNALGSVLLCGLIAVPAGLAGEPGPAGRALALSGAACLVAVGLMVAARERLWRLVSRPGTARVVTRWTPRRFRSKTGWQARIARPLLGQGGRWTAMGADIALGAASFGSLCMANVWVLAALGADISAWRVSLAVVAGYFAGSALGAWGGVGVTEAALTGLYIRAGVPAESAAAGAIIHRALFYALTLTWGGLGLWREQRRGRPPGGGLDVSPEIR